MKFNAVQKKLNDFRKKMGEDHVISDEDREILQALVEETIAVSQDDLAKQPKKVNQFVIPHPENDNQTLSSEQKFKLRLMEKTGTGSQSIH